MTKKSSGKKGEAKAVHKRIRERNTRKKNPSKPLSDRTKGD